MPQQVPLPLTISCSSKSRLVIPSSFLPFWYLLTRVVPDKFQKSSKTTVCVCVCVLDFDHRVCKPHVWCLSQARINWEGCARKGIQHKNGGMAEMGTPISLDGVAVHPDCSCVCLCYLHFAPENSEDGKMYLLVPAHSDCPGKSPENCKLVACMVLCVGFCLVLPG